VCRIATDVGEMVVYVRATPKEQGEGDVSIVGYDEAGRRGEIGDEALLRRMKEAVWYVRRIKIGARYYKQHDITVEFYPYSRRVRGGSLMAAAVLGIISAVSRFPVKMDFIVSAEVRVCAALVVG
jgi:predicted ATP-dependent protease